MPVQVAAAHVGMRGPQLNHIEAARTGLDEERMRSLAAFYDCTDEEFLHTLAALGASDGKGWWNRHKRKVPTFALDLAELEHWATSAYLNFETFFIPGLLQTEEYIRRTFHNSETSLTSAQIEDSIAFRLERQHVLDGPATFRFVIHEAALLMSFAGKDAMRQQLAHLLEVWEKPNVTIQVFPFSVRATLPYTGPFLITEPPSRALSTVVVDHPGASEFTDSPASVATYRERFEDLSRLALPSGDAATSALPHSGRDSWGLVQHIKHGLELER